MDNDTQLTQVDRSTDGGRFRGKSTRRRFLGAGIVAALLPLLSGCTNYIMGYIVGGFGQASLSYFYTKSGDVVSLYNLGANERAARCRTALAPV